MIYESREIIQHFPFYKKEKQFWEHISTHVNFPV